MRAMAAKGPSFGGGGGWANPTWRGGPAGSPPGTGRPAVRYQASARDRKHGRRRHYPRLKVKNNPKVEVRNVLAYSPKMREIAWQDYYVKDGSKGPMVWQAKRLT